MMRPTTAKEPQKRAKSSKKTKLLFKVPDTGYQSERTAVYGPIYS